MEWDDEKKKALNDSIKRAKEIRQNYDWNWSIFYMVITCGLVFILIELIR